MLVSPAKCAVIHRAIIPLVLDGDSRLRSEALLSLKATQM